MAVRLEASGPQPAGDHWTKGEHPASDTLVRDHDAAFGQELLDITEAEREPEIHPHGALDDVAWIAVARI